MAATVAPSTGQEVRQTSFVGESCNGLLIDKQQEHKKHQHQQQVNEDEDARPQARLVILHRDPDTGFGFVAGSEKPVVVRFVKEGGPSVGKLEPEDQILEINGEDVSKAPRDRVIDLVKSCKQTLKMKVCQPDRSLTNRSRKSSLLTAAKKAKLKSNPSRVRFAEGVLINGSESGSIYSSFDSCVPFMPNVLKVFLENGQTKTFKYDTKTTVQDVLNSLREKLSLKNPHYTTLCVEHMRRRNKLILLNPKDTLTKIANRPGAHNLRCLFRVVFVPKDISEMLLTDPITFEYFYAQSCNDIVEERFAPELKYEIALRLSALHLLQHAIQTGMMTNNGSKVNLKAVEKECTLKPFVPYTLMETMKIKELHKLLNHYMKQNHSQLCPPGQKCLTAIQAKVHYLRIISELPSYGAKIFPMNIRETVIESALLVSRRYGLSHVTNMRSSMPVTLARLEDIISIRLSNHEEYAGYVAVEVHLRNNTGEVPFLRFALEERDAEEFVLMIQGYHRLIMTPQSTDLPYKELPVFSDISHESTTTPVNLNTWKNGSAVKFDVNDDDERNALYDEQESLLGKESGIRSKNRRHSPPPSPLYGETTTAHNDSVNGKTSDQLLSSAASQETGIRKMNKETSSSPPAEKRWLLRSSVPRNSIPPHPRSRSMNPSKSSTVLAEVNDQANEVLDEQETETEDIDFPSIVSMEILESAIVAEKRIKREEVEQRVAEMHKIVSDAQHYLTETDSIGYGEYHHCHNNKETQISDDSESLKSDPDFSATDSLLLIRHTTDGREVDLKKTASTGTHVEVGFNESDTTSDSFSTPGASPLDRTPNGSFKSQIPVRRELNTFSNSLEQTFSHSILQNGCLDTTADHSFIQHYMLGNQEEDDHDSPDISESVPNLSDAENELIETLKKLQADDENYMGLPFMQNTNSFVVEQEIIDLTALPPPGEEDLYDNLQISTNPSEGEFICSENGISSGNYGTEYGNYSAPKSFHLVTHNNTPYSTLTRINGNYSSAHRQSSVDNVSRVSGIEDFIASVCVPPPPTSVSHHLVSSVHEIEDNDDVDDDDLSSLIVPPPPVQERSYPQDDVIAKFWQVTDDVKKIYATLPLVTTAGQLSPNHASSNGLQVSPKPLAARELHSSSSGDSGYESIPVVPSASLPSISKSPNCMPHENNVDAYTVRLVLPADSTINTTNRSCLSTVTESSESNDSKQIQTKSVHEEKLVQERNGICNIHAVNDCTIEGVPLSPFMHPLPTDKCLSHNNNSSVISSSIHSDANQYSLTDGLRITETSIKKIPPQPPLRSKPPIPPTSPSIIERRRQLAKKAQTKAKLGMMPVKETGDAGVGDPDDDSDSRNASAIDGDEEEVSLFNEGHTSDPHADNPIDSSSCLLKQILDTRHFPCEQKHIDTDALHKESNGLQGLANPPTDTGMLFVQVHANIDQLLSRLEDVHENRIRSDPSSISGRTYNYNERVLNQRKDELIIESRAFVTSSKLFVKCATEGSPEVIDHLLDCISLLDRMYRIAESIVVSSESQAQVTCLVDRLKEVAATFSYTISAVNNLIVAMNGVTSETSASKQIGSTGPPSMNQLMNHATSLATTLSALMRTLRAFSSY